MQNKDWMFTVRKMSDSFKVEVKFGTEVKLATLHKSVVPVAKAGMN